MRYFIRGLEIRTENAAKPESAAARIVLNWIKTLPADATVLDLGCGKFRYTIPLAKRVAAVTAVDSEVQLNRIQRLNGQMCSLKEYIEHAFENVRVAAVEEEAWRKRHYDVILCANVLSAIPRYDVRRKLLRSAYSCLKANGVFLVTTQFRNSHYSGWKSQPNAEVYLDGYLVHGDKRISFYGLIDAPRLRRSCVTAGFRILKCGHVKELAFVLATKKRAAAGTQALFA